MYTTRCIPIALLMLLTPAACVRAPGSARSPVLRERATLAADALFEDEIGKANVMTAYEAVARLRPGMLRFRPGLGEDRGADVYLDGLLVGSAEQLGGIPAAHVHEIRFVRSLEASTRYGHVASSGIIFITTKLGVRSTRFAN